MTNLVITVFGFQISKHDRNVDVLRGIRLGTKEASGRVSISSRYLGT